MLGRQIRHSRQAEEASVSAVKSLIGGFLVYSAQSLAVTRRLRQFALLRTLGLQERALAGQLLGEGAALGVARSF
jgi:putative ABC transport system permease protein